MAEKRKSEESNGDQIHSKKLATGDKPKGPRFRGFHASRKGERDEMQDCHVIIDDFLAELPAGSRSSSIKCLSFFAVYDGHGGARAAKFCAENLHRIIAEMFPKTEDLTNFDKDVKRCFVDAFKKIDDEFLAEATKVKPVAKDGTTATAVVCMNNVLYVANLGDSKAILCRWKPEEKKEIALTLTKDHNPNVYDERMRIQKFGGTVKDGRIMGVLEVSRSIGDGPYKNHGLICVPDIKRCTLTENDRYFIIACDGLWKALTNQQAMEIVAEVLKDRTIEGSELRSEEDARWDAVCSRLTAEAVRKGCGDNVTVIAVQIDP